jgi:hypothetical protein
MGTQVSLDLEQLETELCRQAGTRVFLSYAMAEPPAEGDNPLDLRHHLHLRGRRALAMLLKRMGEDSDTSFFHAPHPRFSISHTPEGSYALGLADSSAEAPGLDVQSGHLSEGAARFFLQPHEVQAASHEDLVRLWTVKEAVFKSNPNNAGSGIRDYQLRDASALTGEAQLPNAERSFRYFCHRHAGGWLTMALSSAGASQ